MILNILYTALLFQIAKYNSKLIAYKLLGKIPGLQVNILQIISYAQWHWLIKLKILLLMAEQWALLFPDFIDKNPGERLWFLLLTWWDIGRIMITQNVSRSEIVNSNYKAFIKSKWALSKENQSQCVWVFLYLVKIYLECEKKWERAIVCWKSRLLDKWWPMAVVIMQWHLQTQSVLMS